MCVKKKEKYTLRFANCNLRAFSGETPKLTTKTNRKLSLGVKPELRVWSYLLHFDKLTVHNP